MLKEYTFPWLNKDGIPKKDIHDNRKDLKTMTDNLNRCCAFTGHRPAKFPWKYDEEDSRCVELKAALARQIEILAAAGVTDFFSGMALGTDTWAAMAVLALREKNPSVKLHCVLPCEGQEGTWPAAAQTRYRYILSRADTVEYVSHTYHPKCMLDRNRRLINCASILLAVYNGEQRGGTAATIRFARKADRKIIMIHPITLRITKEGRSE